MLTDIKLVDVNGEPRVRRDLPGPLRIGDPLKLRFRVTRQKGGRHEVLEVDTAFRVSTVAFDASSGAAKQVISVETAVGRPPVWQSVKTPATVARRLSPAVSPRTPV